MRNSIWTAALTLLALLLIPVSVRACLWDYDTLKQERNRFPSTLELITGKFLRHSPEFYQWRIRDRQAKLDAGASDPGLYDDLAVAYQMTGQPTLALKTLEAKEKVYPGLYETYSNRGTFHILTGDFEAGLPDIDRALAINPEAHFGREKYQKWLVEYALTRQKDGRIVFPLADLQKVHFGSTGGFVGFLARQLKVERLEGAEREKAIQGVLGMMRFANYRNPLLLEALGELLVDFNGSWDAKHLAARAYLQASYQVEGEAQEGYRLLAKKALEMQTPKSGEYRSLKLEEIEPVFKAELADAETWYAELKGRESEWIRQGLNADVEFDRLYPADPVLASPEGWETWLMSWWLLLGVGSLVAVVLVGVVWWRLA